MFKKIQQRLRYLRNVALYATLPYCPQCRNLIPWGGYCPTCGAKGVKIGRCSCGNPLSKHGEHCAGCGAKKPKEVQQWFR